MFKWLRRKLIPLIFNNPPIIFSLRDRWILVDYHHDMYELVPTYQQGAPISITLLRKS